MMNCACVQTYTGDSITSSQATAKAATREFHKTKSADTRDGEEFEAPVLAGVEVPTPVFFCSVEPPTMALQKQLDFALECLQKEDPSLKVITYPDLLFTVYQRTVLCNCCCFYQGSSTLS